MKDLYSVLGVSKNAPQDEIKKAYRKLAKELHPDRHKGDEKIADRFKEVSSAYAILGDADKRAKYDRGEIDESGQERAPFGAQGGQGFHGFRGFRSAGGGEQPFSESFEFEGGAEDLFADLFGFGRGRRGGGGKTRSSAHRGRDVSYKLQVSFLDAVKGATKRVTLSNGKTLDVKIPPGVRNGQQIRLGGQGEPGFGGGPTGAALVTVQVAPHPLFRRDGDNIHIDLPISLDEAVLGAKVDVPTIDGKVSLSIPKGSSSGRRLRLRGKGVGRNGRRGDQYVTLKIVLPENPDPALEKAVKNWADKHHYDARQGIKV